MTSKSESSRCPFDRPEFKDFEARVQKAAKGKGIAVREYIANALSSFVLVDTPETTATNQNTSPNSDIQGQTL